MKVLLSNWITGFFDHQYLKKEWINLWYFYIEIVAKEMINLKLIPLVECGQPSPARPKFLDSSHKCVRIILGMEVD